MTFLITDDQLKDVLKRRRKLSYYALTNDWLNGFIEAEGSFFETRKALREHLISNVHSIQMIIHLFVLFEDL